MVSSDDPNARNQRQWMESGDSLMEQEKYEGAEEAYLEAIKLNDQKPGFWFNLGRSRGAQGKYEQAVSAYRKAICIDPDIRLNYDPLGFLGSALLELEKYAEAEEAFRQAIALKPDVGYQGLGSEVHLGLALDGQLKYSDSELVYKEAIRKDQGYGLAWFFLARSLSKQDNNRQSINACRKVISLNQGSWWDYESWALIAGAKGKLGESPSRVIAAYRKMEQSIDSLREEEADWDNRLVAFREPAVSLEEAAVYAIGTTPPFNEDALRFAVKSKARSLGELINFDPITLRRGLDPQERDELDRLQWEYFQIKRERDALKFHTIFYSVTGSTYKHPQSFQPKEESKDLERKIRLLKKKKAALYRRIYSNHPETERSTLGGQLRSLRFSSKRLKRRLKPGEAVLEWLMEGTDHLLGFLVTSNGLVRSSFRTTTSSLPGVPELPLKEWWKEIFVTLKVNEQDRASNIKNKLTSDTLAKWGDLIYAPFIDDLKDVHRIWVSPHSLLTQLPFNAIPFPDGRTREVAIIPSAASLFGPRRTGPRPKPRFTLGIVAADAIPTLPLDLQTEEVCHLRGTVGSAKRRWELTGKESTLINIQKQHGLTRCLVLSCHGSPPTEGDLGSLVLGDSDQPDYVTGRMLVDNILLGEPSNMEVDLVITSACFTGQLELDYSPEWQGLPLAFQAVWKTKAMILTLWEVEELPAMIWVVELVRALTQGLSSSEALRQAQDKVRTVTREQVEAIWLAEAKDRLDRPSPERWERVHASWQETTRTTDQHPFANPVHWAPFVLVGDSKVTISPGRLKPAERTMSV